MVVEVIDAGGLSDTETFSIAVQFDNTGDDALTGDGGDNVIDGGPGNDQIWDQDGNDHLIGGGGKTPSWVAMAMMSWTEVTATSA